MARAQGARALMALGEVAGSMLDGDSAVHAGHGDSLRKRVRREPKGPCSIGILVILTSPHRTWMFV